MCSTETRIVSTFRGSPRQREDPQDPDRSGREAGVGRGLLRGLSPGESALGSREAAVVPTVHPGFTACPLDGSCPGQGPAAWSAQGALRSELEVRLRKESEEGGCSGPSQWLCVQGSHKQVIDLSKGTPSAPTPWGAACLMGPRPAFPLLGFSTTSHRRAGCWHCSGSGRLADGSGNSPKSFG